MAGFGPRSERLDPFARRERKGKGTKKRFNGKGGRKPPTHDAIVKIGQCTEPDQGGPPRLYLTGADECGMA